MYKKLLYLLLIFTTLLVASTNTINNKILVNTKILNKKKSQQKSTNTKIKKLAKSIQSQENEYQNIKLKLENLNNTIFLNRVKLSRVKKEILKLELQTKNIKTLSLKTQTNIVDEITNRYSNSLGVSLAKKHTLDEIIDKEIYTLLLEESSSNIVKLNSKYLQSTKNMKKNKDKNVELTKYIKYQNREKVKYKKLKLKKQDIIQKLASEHKRYQNRLKTIVYKQKNLQQLLSNLNILKIKEIQKKKALTRKRKRIAYNNKTNKIKISQKKQLEREIDTEVRNIGSSTRGVKITKYKGSKTIAPLKSYKVVKKFGKYYDPVYKIELFNEALSMKPKQQNSKVYNIFKGKIVYAKKNSGSLENVVIVQHKNGLHTIYSHLDKIAPTLKTGKWIKKGFVVGRVSDTLMFQSTKNSKYINPKDLFR